MPERYLLSSCVCLSVTSRHCIKSTGRIDLVFGMLASLYPSCRVLLGNSDLQNKGASLWNFLPNSALIKFCRSKSMMLSTKLPSTVKLVDHTYDGRRVVAVYYRSVDCNPLNSITSICCTALFLQLCSSWQDFNWHCASCSLSAVAELLVIAVVSIVWSFLCIVCIMYLQLTGILDINTGFINVN